MKKSIFILFVIISILMVLSGCNNDIIDDDFEPEGDFEPGIIILCLNKIATSKSKIYTKNDFPEIKCSDVENLSTLNEYKVILDNWGLSSSEKQEYINNFRQIIFVYLIDETEEYTIKALKI